MNRIKNPRIVVIGGGTGSFTLLSGLKHHTSNITALVSMADNGGSTGVLRDELGALPPGDVRQCLVALAQTPEMRDLFNFRFTEGSLAGHSFGNLFLTAVEQMAGSNFTEAVTLASRVLNIRGQVLPVTLDNVQLVLRQADGTEIRGESNLDHMVLNLKRPQVSLEPRARLTKEGEQALLAADVIIVAPGSIYGSLAAVLVVEGVTEALAKSPAQKIYVCNLLAEKGQSDNFLVHDFADEIERFLQNTVKLDHVIYNTSAPPAAVLARYAEEGELVAWDESVLGGKHYQAHGLDLLAQPKVGHESYIRHDPNKIATAIMELRR